jgi:hypothetical protein
VSFALDCAIAGFLMSLLAAIRRHQIRASRLVAALAAVAWFGFVVVPCQASPDPLLTGSSHDGSMPAGDCGHCPDTNSGPDDACATIAAPDCVSQVQAVVERRPVDDPKPQAAPPLSFLDFDAYPPDIGPPADARFRPTPVSSASVQQRYCTYLK